AGLRRVALSLDAPTEEAHDAFRGVPGSYAKTLELLEAARDLGLSTQVNTTVTRANACTFEEMAEAALELPIDLWSVFFLVPTGRASAAQTPTAKQVERVFEIMADTAERAPFPIKATEAPHYRRYLLQRDPEAFGRSPNRLGLRDGHGVVFVSHVGDVYPSGFMPMRVGNVRAARLPDIYRHSPELRALRRPELFGGKCGWCEHRELCGGSRARAYALTGDPLGPEPTCVYLPARPEERAYFAAGI
ncbi:MAG: radical SAM/SPASM domain-containing protein, partial [Candidatus Methylomirabilis sp.]|nr:radical SAM/SPASM domain-containing protein [Deltaproteobacteria bacterium]